jgi:DNA repair exonuclease SbcCD ATPase subunit
LTNVRQHRDAEFEFAPGLTIVRGPNEVGKSTIARAIELGLFRRATSTSRDVAAIRAWDGGTPALELDVELDGHQARLRKWFAGARGTVTLELVGATVDDPDRVDQILADALGLPTERLYRSTASVNHGDIANLGHDEGALRDRLEQVISGGDGTTSVALRRLDETIRRYRGQSPRNPGPLKEARDNVSHLTVEFERGERALVELERERAALVESTDERQRLQQEVETAESELANVERDARVASAATEATDRYERLRRAIDAREVLDRHPGVDATEAARRVRALVSIRVAERDLAALGRGDPSWWSTLGFESWFGVVGLTLTVAIATAIAYLYYPIPLVLLIAGLLLVAALAQVPKLAKTLSGDRDVGSRDAAHGARQRGLRALGIPDDRRASERLAAEEDIIREIERAHAELSDDAFADLSLAELTALRDHAAVDAQRARDALRGLGHADADPAVRLPTARRRLDALRQQFHEAVAAEARASGALAREDIDTDTVARAAERRDEAQRHLESVERRLAVYEATRDAIRAAEEATLVSVRDALQTSIGRDIGVITDGRYARARVGSRGLEVEVYSVEKDDWVRAADLSQGTFDQIYISARLALVRLIAGNRRPPLLLDDPFLAFDHVRAVRAMDLLRSIAADFQVVYFTTTDRYDEHAERVIALTARQAGS